MDYRIGILVLGYNSKQYIQECFDSIQSQDYKKIILYFGDNGSSDDSVSYVKEHYPLAKVLDFKANHGFAKGNNLLLKEAFGKGMDLCLVLNPDTVLVKNSVSTLINSYESKREKNLKVGLIQPVLLLYQDKTKINTIGNAVHLMGFGFCKDQGKKYVPIKEDKEILSVSGAAMLISKELFDVIGGFDEDFFMYSEDEDLSLRAFLYGYTNYLSSRSILYHKYSFSKNKNKWFYEERNRFYILFKNYPSSLLLFLILPAIATEILVTLYSIIDGWLVQKVKSYVDVFSQLPGILKKRSEIRGKVIASSPILVHKLNSSLEFEGVTNRAFIFANVFYFFIKKTLLILY